MEAVIGAARQLVDAAGVIKFIESLLVRLDLNEDMRLLTPVHVPLYKARQLGLIDPETHRQVLAEARAEWLARMKQAIERLPPEKSSHRSQLEAVMGNVQRFAQVARRLKVPFEFTYARWEWPVRSVVDQVQRGTRSSAWSRWC